MKEVPEWRIEPQATPNIYFTKDVYYIGALYPRMKVKWSDAAGLTAYVKNPNNAVIWTAETSKMILKFHEFWVDSSYPTGMYTAELKKEGVVVASDTAVLRSTPKCKANERFCLFGDLWRCIDGYMQEYEKNSSYCIRNGFHHTSQTSPDTLRLPEGSIDMMFTKEGYEDKVIRGVSIKKGKTTSLVVILPKKLEGYLECKTTPTGARIWGRQSGGPEFPEGFVELFEETPATILLAPGKYDFAFTFLGYKPEVIEEVVIEGGKTTSVEVTLGKISPEGSYLKCESAPSGAKIWLERK